MNPTVPPDVFHVAGSTRKISQLIGDTDTQWLTPTRSLTESRFGIRGTDLGVPFTHKGVTYLVFGDVPVAEMRDPMAFTTNTDLENGLQLTFYTNGAVWRPITIPGISQGIFEVPLDGVSVNDKMYLYYSTDHSAAAVMGRSVVAVSADDGMNFRLLYTLSRSNFINVSVNLVIVEDWPGFPQATGAGLALFGSGVFRASDVRLAFQPATAIEDPAALRYFAGLSAAGDPTWSSHETDAIALFDQPCVGELSVGYNKFLRRWVMFYNCDSLRGINFRTARQPWGPWSQPQVLFDPWNDGGYARFIHVDWNFRILDGVQTGWIPGGNRDSEWGSEYGSYMFKEFATGSDNRTTIYFTMSTWNPYVSVLMKTELQVTNAPVITVQPVNQVVATGETARFELTASAVGALDFQWQRDATNLPGATSNVFTLPNASTADTNALFRSLVSNASGSLTSNPVRLLIISPEQPPVSQILAPMPDALYRGGQTIAFAGEASDAEDGMLPASAYRWKVLFVHGNYTVPYLGTLEGVTNGAFTVPTRGETATNVSFRILLTVTDSGGRSTTVCRDIFPRVSTVTLVSQPPGLQTALDSQALTLPVEVPSVVGMQRTVTAFTPASLAGRDYDFRDWSDGGAVTHTILVAETNTALTVTFSTPTVLVPTNASWKYLVSAGEPTSSWRNRSFDDSAWPSGPARLGYGVGGEGTLIGFGGNPTNRNLTTYFRCSLPVADPSVFGALLLRLLRADGGIIYLNATEVFRSNLGGGSLRYWTRALTTALPTDETSQFYSTNIPASLLVAGTNVLAAEIHKNDPTKPYLSFALELRAAERDPRLEIMRAGPGLQLSWPVPSAGYSLPSAMTLRPSPSWSPFNSPVVPTNSRNVVTVPTDAESMYFRLSKP